MGEEWGRDWMRAQAHLPVHTRTAPELWGSGPNSKQLVYDILPPGKRCSECGSEVLPWCFTSTETIGLVRDGGRLGKAMRAQAHPPLHTAPNLWASARRIGKQWQYGCCTVSEGRSSTRVPHRKLKGHVPRASGDVRSARGWWLTGVLVV